MTPPCILLCLLALLQPGSCELAMLYVVHRHGARELLPKTSTLSENSAYGGPTLLPEGMRQLYNAGRGLYSRYLNRTSCLVTSTCLETDGSGINYGLFNTSGVGFHEYNTLARSSALDRTIMSARSFFAGAFPPNASVATSTSYLPDGEQIIPVYMNQDDNDYLVRSYTKCPAYNQVLQTWYTSDEFKLKESATQEFRLSIRAMVPNMDCNLTNWWNVYDAWTVFSKYGVGDSVPVISDAEYNEMAAIAYWLEVRKMRSTRTGSWLGSPLLTDMVERMKSCVEGSSSSTLGAITGSGFRLLTVSAHYNTLLTVLSAMSLDGYEAAALAMANNRSAPSNWLATGELAAADMNPKIPSPGALIALELHTSSASASTDASQFAVRLVVQDGPSSNYLTIPLPCSGGDANQIVGATGACTYQRFVDMVGGVIMNSDDPSSWCDGCNNVDVDICIQRSQAKQIATQDALIAELESQLLAQSTPFTSLTPCPECNKCDDGNNRGYIITTIILVLVLVAGIMACVVREYRRATQASADRAAQGASPSYAAPAVPTSVGSIHTAAGASYQMASYGGTQAAAATPGSAASAGSYQAAVRAGGPGSYQVAAGAGGPGSYQAAAGAGGPGSYQAAAGAGGPGSYQAATGAGGPGSYQATAGAGDHGRYHAAAGTGDMRDVPLMPIDAPGSSRLLLQEGAKLSDA